MNVKECRFFLGLANYYFKPNCFATSPDTKLLFAPVAIRALVECPFILASTYNNLHVVEIVVRLSHLLHSKA